MQLANLRTAAAHCLAAIRWKGTGNTAFRAELDCDMVVLKDFSQLLAVPLRDGCDLMGVVARRLRAQAKG